jgi:hypothetical protein
MIREPSSSRVHVEDVLWRLRRNRELDRLYRNVQRSPDLRGHRPTWTCSLSRRLLFPGLPALTATGAHRVGVIWGPNLLQRPKPQPEPIAPGGWMNPTLQRITWLWLAPRPRQ